MVLNNPVDYGTIPLIISSSFIISLLVTLTHVYIIDPRPTILLTSSSVSSWTTASFAPPTLKNLTQLSITLPTLSRLWSNGLLCWFPGTSRHTIHTIFINQAQYLTDILQQFRLDQANPVSTTADTHVHLQETFGLDDLPLSPSIPY